MNFIKQPNDELVSLIKVKYPNDLCIYSFYNIKMAIHKIKFINYLHVYIKHILTYPSDNSMH